MNLRSNVAKTLWGALLAVSVAACATDTTRDLDEAAAPEPEGEASAVEADYLEAVSAAEALELAGASPERMEVAWDEVDRRADAVLAEKRHGFEDRSRDRAEPAPPPEPEPRDAASRDAEARYLELVAKTDPNDAEAVRALEAIKKVSVPQ